jgi:hypothetical protein
MGYKSRRQSKCGFLAVEHGMMVNKRLSFLSRPHNFRATLQLSAILCSASLKTDIKLFPVMRGRVAKPQRTRHPKLSQENAVASEGAGMHVGSATVSGVGRHVDSLGKELPPSYSEQSQVSDLAQETGPLQSDTRQRDRHGRTDNGLELRMRKQNKRPRYV